MARPRLFTVYALTVALVGLGLAVVTTALQAPHDLHSFRDDIVTRGLILLILTFLSSFAPMKTRYGASLTVGLAPLFGALLTLPPWAVMWVAALGTMDERIPGRTIPWNRFLFSRGMFALVYGLPGLGLAALGFPAAPISPQPTWYLIQPFVIVLIVALNDGLVAAFFSLLQGSSFWHLAKNTVAGSWLTYIALPVVGYLIYQFLLFSMPQRLGVFLLYGPLLVYRASLQKQNRLDQWLRDSFIMQSRVVDKRDGQTFGHSQRVGEMCETVARMLHLSEDACNTIRVGGILHDLGKIAIPDSILLKPGKLTPEEYEIIKTHPTEGAAILAEHPEQRDVALIVMHHHERWDGAGYPIGLKGAEIPLGSRIVNACDAFDTITQARVFRPTVKTPAEAIRYPDRSSHPARPDLPRRAEDCALSTVLDRPSGVVFRRHDEHDWTRDHAFGHQSFGLGGCAGPHCQGGSDDPVWPCGWADRRPLQPPTGHDSCRCRSSGSDGHDSLHGPCLASGSLHPRLYGGHGEHVLQSREAGHHSEPCPRSTAGKGQ